MKTRVLVVTATVLLAGGVAAGCSSSGSTSGSASSSAPAPTSAPASAPASGGGGSSPLALTTHTVSGVGTVVEANGRTVYFDNRDTTGRIVCTGGCAAVWVPVTTTSTPASVDGVTFGTVTRPDGTTQLTADGHPVYTFSRDTTTSDAFGQGAKDSFSGQSFSWHAVTTAMAGTARPSPTAPSGGYGGY